MNDRPRYQVRRTLLYSPTLYGETDDLAEAKRWMEQRAIFGYPCEVIDTKHNLRFGWHR